MNKHDDDDHDDDDEDEDGEDEERVAVLMITYYRYMTAITCVVQETHMAI